MNEFDVNPAVEADLSAYKQRKKSRVRTEKVVGTFSTVVMILLALSITSLNEMVKVSFSFRDVVWSAFAYSLIAKIATIYLCKYVGADLRYRYGLDDNEVKDAKKRFFDLSNHVNIPDFEAWVYRENERRKRKAYKDGILTRIAAADTTVRLLEYRQKAKYRRRRSRKIARKKSHIQEWYRLITDEYIDEHIVYIRVKYVELKVNDFITPAESGAPDVEKYGMSEQREITKDISRGMPWTIALTFALTLLGSSYVFYPVNAFVLLADICILIFYFTQGFFVTGKKTVSLLVHVYCARAVLLLRYNSEIGTKTDDNADGATDTHAVQYAAPVVEKSAS